jgi:(+)-trans-carveol dehydrogenase
LDSRCEVTDSSGHERPPPGGRAERVQEEESALGRLDGRVAFITGAARGQGRSHAVRLAREGADIIAIDVCAPVEGAFPTAAPEDLAETVRMVEAEDRRIVASTADVRDYDAVEHALAEGLGELGRLDIVVANAGIADWFELKTAENISAGAWQTMLDINLTGVWHTCKAAIPHLSDGAALVLTSSATGLKGVANISHYVAAKHGVVGLMRSLSQELGPRMIRVNCVCPGQVGTDMILNQPTYDLFCPDIEEPTRDDFAAFSQATFLMPSPWLEPEDISNAVAFLVSDEARFITGVALPVDAGFLAR